MTLNIIFSVVTVEAPDDEQNTWPLGWHSHCSSTAWAAVATVTRRMNRDWTSGWTIVPFIRPPLLIRIKGHGQWLVIEEPLQRSCCHSSETPFFVVCSLPHSLPAFADPSLASLKLHIWFYNATKILAFWAASQNCSFVRWDQKLQFRFYRCRMRF